MKSNEAFGISFFAAGEKRKVSGKKYATFHIFLSAADREIFPSVPVLSAIPGTGCRSGSHLQGNTVLNII
jgi:hypothetical protein